MIQVGVVGSVLNGRHPDMKVEVIDDTNVTGGFLIFQWWPDSGGPNSHGAFDDWVESREALERYWQESGWLVRWDAPEG